MRPWIGYFGRERSPWDRWIAYLCAIFYLVAGIGALTWISPGYPLAGETVSALKFVDEDRLSWRLGWSLVLVATTLQLIFFCIVTNRIRPGVGSLGSSVLVVGGFGIITVWLFALVGMLKVPAMAEELLQARAANLPTLFHQHVNYAWLLEQMDTNLVLVGNTFLWGAGLLLSLLCLRDPRFPRWLLVFSLLPWAAGAVTTAGAFLPGWSGLRTYGLLVYVPLFAVWSFFMGLFYLDIEETAGAESPGRSAPVHPGRAPLSPPLRRG